MKKQFAVVGLGRFGSSVCRTLISQGAEVLAIDIDAAKVDEFREIATHAVVADSTDEQALKNLGVRNFEHIVVAIGDNIQASILTTLILTELGVQHITVKAQNDYHEKVLNKIGAERVIHPERDMGLRIAHNLLSKNVIEYFELSDHYSIIELLANQKMCRRSLNDLNIRARYGCTIVAIKRMKEVIVAPQADEIIQQGDVLIIIGEDDKLSRLEQQMTDK